MNLVLSDDQKHIVRLAEDFAEQLREQARDSEANGIASLRSSYEELALLKMDWPESAGGFGLGSWSKAMTLEALAFGDPAATLALDRSSWIGSPMLRCEALCDRVGQVLVSASAPGLVIDIDERIDEQNGVLTGVVSYLPGAACDALFVMRGDRLHCIEAGLSCSPVIPGALHALGACSVTLDGAVPTWSVDLEPEAAAALRGGVRLALAAVLVGLANASSLVTRAFCLDRIAFGKKLAHHQALAFILADMEIATEAARLSVWEAAQRLDEQGLAHDCHAAFVEATECALFVSNYGVQLHGGHGYVEDYPVEKWMREARAISLLAGGVDGARADLARELDARLRQEVA